MHVSIEEAVHRIRQGEVIVFPTETVYGLGCDPRSEAAVRRIYELKGRADDKPLSLHLANLAQARPFIENWPEQADLLAQSLWPGPLTLILPRSAKLGSFVTSGQSTVGLRCPDHALLQSFLRLLDQPLAGTSANRSGEPPATDALDAEAIFPDLPIIDGGACAVGEASTVIDLTGERIRIIREGSLPVEAIRRLVGPDMTVDTA